MTEPTGLSKSTRDAPRPIPGPAARPPPDGSAPAPRTGRWPGGEAVVRTAPPRAQRGDGSNRTITTRPGVGSTPGPDVGRSIVDRVVRANPRGEPASGRRPEEGGADAASTVRPWAVSSACTPAHGPGFSKEILRKEVIQPQVPLRLPCYDLVPITGFIFGACLAAPATSDAPRFGGLTGGVYKAQEHIHRGSADPRLLAIPASCGRVAARNPNWGAVFAISAALRPGVALSAPL